MIIVLSTGENLSLGGDFGIGGWTPVLALVTVGERVLQQVVDFTGGSGVKPDIGLYVGPAGLVVDPDDATNVRGATGVGDPGNNAWTAIEAIVEDGDRRVKKVVDWIGGTGDKPDVGMYVGPAGYVALASQATNVAVPAMNNSGLILDSNGRHFSAITADSLLVTPLRQVASNCRFPEIFSTVRQLFSESQHRAGQTIKSLMVEFCNFATNSEQVKASALTVFTAIEWPILSGNIYIFGYHNGQMIGSVPGGGIIRSDLLSLPFAIPKGEWFSLWHHHTVFNNSDGIPTVKGLPSTKFGNTKGRCVIGGGSYPQLNYILSKVNSFLPGLANTVVDSDEFITPTAIIANPTDDYDFNARGIIGDSRSASATCLPTDARLLNGLAERLFCGDGRSFISLACNGESEYNDFDPSGMYFQRRSHFLRYVDEVVNALGTNDANRFTSPAVTRALELRLLENRFIAGKKIHTLTVPYKASSSNDYFTSLAGQTMDVNNANYDNVNDYRLRNPDGLYTTVKDAASIVCDKVAKKWKPGPRARVEVASIAAGTNLINVPAGTLAPADNNVPAVMLAGTANAALFGLLAYVTPTQATWWTLNKIRESTGVALNAVVTVNNGNLYIDARHYTADGIHDTPPGVLEQEAALA